MNLSENNLTNSEILQKAVFPLRWCLHFSKIAHIQQCILIRVCFTPDRALIHQGQRKRKSGANVTTIDCTDSWCFYYFYYFTENININSLTKVLMVLISKPTSQWGALCGHMGAWRYIFDFLMEKKKNTLPSEEHEQRWPLRQVGHFSKPLLQKWAILRRWFYTATVEILSKSIFVN